MTIEQYPQSVSNKDIGSLPADFPTLSGTVLDLFLLKGKAAVITGGARGIGYAIAEAYSEAGVSYLGIMDYSDNRTALEELQDKFPKTKVQFWSCDVRSLEQVGQVVTDIRHTFGSIDIFVANAGIAWTAGPLIDQPDDREWKNVFDIDVDGVYQCAKHVGRVFRDQGSGSMVMTASMSAHIVNVPQLQAGYNAAKAAVLQLGKSLAIEWAPFARVNTVSPGYIATELSDFVSDNYKNIWYSLIPKGRQGLARELVGAYLYLASDASTYTTGTDLRVDGGYTSI